MATIFSALASFIAQSIVIMYPPVFVFWLLIHLNIERWRRIGVRSYYVATLAWPIISGPLFYFRRNLFAVRWEPPAWLVAVGVLAGALGALALALASRIIPAKTLVGAAEIRQTNSQPLLHAGIYGRTRNPIYLGHSLIILGAAATTGFLANWILLAVDVVVLPLVIRAEEHELLKRYGSAYSNYMKKTPRLFPIKVR